MSPVPGLYYVNHTAQSVALKEGIHHHHHLYLQLQQQEAWIILSEGQWISC